MQVLLLGLFVALFLHDATVTGTAAGPDGAVRAVEALPADAWPYLGPLPVAIIVLGPKALLALVYQTACMRTRRRLGSPAGQRALNRLERLTAALPFVLLLLFACDLTSGALRVVRLALREVVLLDEAVVLLPTLAVAALSWWSYYPVDRRLRESVIFRNADSGRPVYPLLTRGQYISMQARHQFGLLLLPLLAVFAWAEALLLLGPSHRGLISEETALILTPVGVLAVFMLAPLVIRYVWHTAPLAGGEVRDRMLALCRRHGVRVRELLLWRTGGGMVNAAVTGLVPRVRFILLSDGLLDQVPPRAVEAVMAHEIAHVKLRHIVWMVLVLIASIGLFELGANLLIDHVLVVAVDAALTDATSPEPAIDLRDPQTRTLLTAVPVFLLAMVVFGWVSRRIERQADVFAARHLARSAEHPQHDDLGRPVFGDDAIDTMVHALQRVAELNHAPVQRKSWRHGSIAWRQNHLRSLIGRPIDDTPVDRVLARVKVAAGLALAVVLLASFGGGLDVGALLAA